MAKRKGMKFRTTQEKQTKRFRLFVLGFVGFLLAFALLSVAYMLKSHRLSTADLFPQKEVESTEGSTDEALAQLSGKATFMLACVSDEKDELYFVAAVNADLDSGEVRMCAFSPIRRRRSPAVRTALRDYTRPAARRSSRRLLTLSAASRRTNTPFRRKASSKMP